MLGAGPNAGQNSQVRRKVLQFGRFRVELVNLGLGRIVRFPVIGILNKIFRKREKPRVFLGTIVVVPRAGMKPRLDEWGMFQREELETPLQATLQQIFSLPPASEVRDLLPTDLGLDVFVPSFQSGAFWSASLGDIGIPIFGVLLWRPKVTVTCRLYSLQTRATKATFSVTKKMPWREYASRLLTLRAFLRLRPIFSADDLNHLLNLACHSILNKLTKAT
jgi:hypothetical protein